MSPRDVGTYVSELAKEISGQATVSLDDYVYRDLRITGGDAVEFYQTIEERFSVDIRPITEIESGTSKRRFLGVQRKVEPRDLPLKEIVTFIVQTQRLTYE